MHILKVNRYRVTKRDLAAALEVLRNGGVVVHPTESSYGLAVDPANPAAVRRLFALKGRPDGKPVLVVAASVGQALRHVGLSRSMRRLAERHWPGPLTVVGRPLSSLLSGGGRSGKAAGVAIRVPASCWARALAAGLGRPVTSTSANVSGSSPAYSAAAVRRAFAGSALKPDLMIDAGTLPSRPPSTLVRERRGRIEVLRAGPVRVMPNDR